MNPQGRRMGQFVVSVDPKGSLAFSGPVLARRGRPAAHVIQAVTEQVDPAYLAYLRQVGVSYLFAGKEQLDCPLLLEKLAARFGVQRLMVAGGGVVNWSFLQAGCVDEVSLVVAPVADGSTTAVSSFERGGFLPNRGPVALSLAEAKPLAGDGLCRGTPPGGRRGRRHEKGSARQGQDSRSLLLAALLLGLSACGTAEPAQAEAEAPAQEAIQSAAQDGAVTQGTETYRGFQMDNVLHHPQEGDIHYHLHLPEGYDGTIPCALFVTLPGV